MEDQFLQMGRHRSYSELPDEIIFHILSRIPAKSVGLCRCVSKPWQALLSQPKFVKTHLQISKINSLESLIIHAEDSKSESAIYSAPLNNTHHLLDEITMSSLTKLSLDKHDSIHGSCDGLLLVSDIQDNNFVINPLTRKKKQVPHLPFASAHTDEFYWYAFHYGFGYDSVMDDYKIVVISYLCTDKDELLVTKDNFVDLYSLKTSSWKRLESPPYTIIQGTIICSGTIIQGAFVGGCAHWLATNKDDKDIIMAFNLADEKFLEIPLPDDLILDYSDDVYELGVLGGFLCIYLYNHHEVWVKKEQGVSEAWTKFTMNVPHGWVRVAWFFLNSQEQVIDNHFVWNPKEGTWKKIVFNRSNSRPYHILHVEASFVESLVSP